MAKKPDTTEMAELYRKGKMTHEEIGELYGIGRKAVSNRLTSIGVYRPPRKYKRIDKKNLEQLYTVEKLSLEELAKHFQTHITEIIKSLRFHKIPRRPRLQKRGRHADILRTLEIGDIKILSVDTKKPQASLHRSANNLGIKISVRSIDEEFEVKRIE